MRPARNASATISVRLRPDLLVGLALQQLWQAMAHDVMVIDDEDANSRARAALRALDETDGPERRHRGGNDVVHLHHHQADFLHDLTHHRPQRRARLAITHTSGTRSPSLQTRTEQRMKPEACAIVRARARKDNGRLPCKRVSITSVAAEAPLAHGRTGDAGDQGR
jgi:hypothetical protein